MNGAGGRGRGVPVCLKRLIGLRRREESESAAVVMVSLEMSLGVGPLGLIHSQPLAFTLNSLSPVHEWPLRVELGYQARSRCVCCAHQTVGLNLNQSTLTHPHINNQIRLLADKE